LQPYKGPDLLIRAFSGLDNTRGATLTIYGGSDGYEEYFKQLQALAKDNERIRFAGTVKPSELGAVFSEADYFILPSLWHENSPLILLDALQSKTPVIASDIGGVRDVVEHGVNGFLFPMGNVQALREIMQRAVDRPEELKRLRAGARLPDIQDYARELLALCRVRKGASLITMAVADQPADLVG
jgi:glycosyltransferase involved in cell wall biosynthesis